MSLAAYIFIIIGVATVSGWFMKILEYLEG